MPRPREATCVICGCTDSRACVENGEPCGWVLLDRVAGKGLCSVCDRLLGRMIRARLVERGVREAAPQLRDEVLFAAMREAGIEPDGRG